MYGSPKFGFFRATSLISAVLVCFIDNPAKATDSSFLTTNPAFCYGVASAVPNRLLQMKIAPLAEIRRRFAKAGPKDSTDGRGFEDWAAIGRSAAREDAGRNAAMLLSSCAAVLRPR
jgi:hypothetical protein